MNFEGMVAEHAVRTDLVDNILNAIGPQMEKGLTLFMESAFEDVDKDAA